MKTALLAMVRFYQWLVSPMLRPACRYTPTCSQYAAEAVELRGAWRGVALAAWRLLRCHPFARGGFDPVPQPARPAPIRNNFLRGPNHGRAAGRPSLASDSLPQEMPRRI